MDSNMLYLVGIIAAAIVALSILMIALVGLGLFPGAIPWGQP